MPSSAPTRAHDVAFREIDGEMILVSGSRACSHSLNPVGGFVWSLIDGQRTVEEIATGVAERFGITPESALEDVRAFIDEISREGLVAGGQQE
jgi:hypothetical protein